MPRVAVIGEEGEVGRFGEFDHCLGETDFRVEKVRINVLDVN